MTVLSPVPGDLAAFHRDLAALGESQRYWRLNQYEALWKGKQYTSRPSFWDPEVPLQERAPCVQSGVAETAIGRLVGLVFGNARFPALSPGESDYGVDLATAERAALAALVARLVKLTGLRVVMRLLLGQGLGVGSACVLASLRRGQPRLRILAAKYCEPDLDGDGELRSLTVSFLAEDERGNPLRHRRVIDATHDTTFFPTDPRRIAAGAPWVPDPDRTVQHGLGFVPAIWHRNSPDPSDLDEVDGVPLFAGLEPEIEALDLAMSQRHRNGRYNGEPQIVRTGVDPDATPVPLGEAGRETAGRYPKGWIGRASAAVRGWYGGRPATKKAPGKIWDLATGSDAKLLESSGAGAVILQGDIDGLRRTIYESRGVVIASPEQISANASAALMRSLYEPMVGVADNLREEYGELLARVVSLLLRLCAAPSVRDGGVFVRGLAPALPALARATVATVEGPRWVGVPLECQWGEYFEPTWDDVSKATGAAMAANGGRPVLTHRQSVQLLARVAHSDDVDATLAQIQAEQAGERDAQGALLDRLATGGPPAATPRIPPMGSSDAPEVTLDAPAA